jgi:hypothetical protein
MESKLGKLFEGARERDRARQERMRDTPILGEVFKTYEDAVPAFQMGGRGLLWIVFWPLGLYRSLVHSRKKHER